MTGHKHIQSQGLPFVSVIIPTLSSELLKPCLNALAQQTYPANLYEVIIVDNSDYGINVETRSPLGNVKVVQETRKGSSFARNKGIDVATGEVLAFTDADCIPDSCWIENGVEHLLHRPTCGLVAGKIKIFFKQAAHPTASELFDYAYGFQQDVYIEKWHFGATANVITRKSVFEKVGVFKESLISGMDLEWGNRVFQAGYEQVYAPDAIVAHPARDSLKKISGKHARVISGLFQMHREDEISFWAFIFRILYDWPKPMDFAKVLTNQQLKGWRQKFCVLGIMICIRIIRTKERLRLRWGGKPRWDS